MPPENLPTKNRLPPGSDGYSVSDVLPELARAHAEQRAADMDGVEDLVVSLPLSSLDDVDRYPRWHSSYPRESIVRALLLKHVLGLDSDSALRRELRSNPYLLGRLGFDTVPNQSTLWRAQNRRFGDELLGALRAAGRELADAARSHGLDAPGPVEDDRDEDAGRDGRLSSRSAVTSETEKLASEAKRLVHPHLSLERADNSCIPESAFWALQTFCGLRENLHVNEGARAFALDSTRDVTPGGHNHRAQLRDLDTETVGEMFQSAVGELVAEAKASGEFDRTVAVGIDLTTKPFLGSTEGLEDDVFGAKDADAAYHWATVQVIDGGPPFVLDARPVRRGESRAEIVADLLDNALQHVSIELVQMDREFDAEAVKTACETRGVTYLNPKRKYASEKATCRRLARAGKTVHVEEQATVTSGATRKQVYVPSRRASDRDQSEGTDPEREEYRQQLWGELADELGLDLGGDTDDQMFADVAGWFSEADEGGEERQYAVFETNAGIDTDAEGDALLHEVAGVIRRYRDRWTVENSFKSIKQFTVPTTSRSPVLRFFNFAFACLLFDVWRVVDLLVRQVLGVEDGPVVPFSRVLQFVRRETGVG